MTSSSSGSSGSSTITPPVFSIPQHYLFPQLLVVRWAIRTDRQTDGRIDRRLHPPVVCCWLMVSMQYMPLMLLPLLVFHCLVIRMICITFPPSRRCSQNKQPQTDGKTPAIIHNKQNNNTRTYCHFVVVISLFLFLQIRFVLFLF